MRLKPAPAVWRVPPVSPPIWNTKSFELLVDTPVSHGAEFGQLGLFACATGRAEFGSNGLAVLAPEIANITTPYHVSPVFVVVMEMLSELKGFGAIAYHS